MRLPKTMKVAQHVTDVVLDVSAKNEILGEFEFFICCVVLLNCTVKIISAFFGSRSYCSKRDAKLIVIGAFNCVIGNSFKQRRVISKNLEDLFVARLCPLNG